ncbi:MAG TPA: hypothetical protein PJ990_16005, partial [Saprospiraceae bacterium]|nr:hypothetical protein [Saprospiraceae bacterium]
MEEISVIGIVSLVVTGLISFLIGKSGIITRLYDTRIRKIESNQKKESDMIDEAIEENKALRIAVAKYTQEVTELKAEINEYKKSMELVLEYLKKLNID